MKKIIIVLYASLMCLALQGQDYKVSKSSGRLEIIGLNNVTIEGATGNEIIFSSMDRNNERDQRAAGLKAVNSMGMEDNTGLGISVVEKDGVVEVHQLKKMDGPKVRIQVPKGIIISYSHTSPHGSDVVVKNMENQVEVSTVHNDVRLENVTGPLNVKTVHGDTDVIFGEVVKAPVSITSAHGHVDVTWPAAVKATFNMETSFGEIFIDPALKVEIPKDGEWVKYGANKVQGKVGGGGMDVTLSSQHDNVYLRKR